MAEKLESSRVDRILSLIDDALDDGPCWRCDQRPGTGGTGLCEPCVEVLRREETPRQVAHSESWARTPEELLARLTFEVSMEPLIPLPATEEYQRTLAVIAPASAALVEAFAGAMRALGEALDEALASRLGDWQRLVQSVEALGRREASYTSLPGRGLPPLPPKPPRTCPRHGVLMDAGLCRPCVRTSAVRSFAR